ncbi:protein-methionine-sulfoxide reductase catalytic subunit MsrP [Lichenihabitans psoromatis]|uniref:protein-methionine-sulfoxide reductase catalytic subunit MsrP n=1 Tax=Lichenihabitans psoromatis TaxID=2528642 RepID=UPI0010362D59|nr:protein-methionine-sulfoxide reductase catalytic subunit MsrP [Lichenihabitans psoromatis]
MLIRHRETWSIAERDATPEHVFLNRRSFVAGAALAGAAIGTGMIGLPRSAMAAGEVDPSASLYPAKANPAYTISQAVTPEAVNTNYNNFYEYGETKHIADAAQALKIRPWMVSIDGMVDKPKEIAIDDLLKAMPLEERLYRHRCVEAWSMAVPWTGFPVKALVDFAKPLGSAKYIQVQTFLDPKMAPGQRGFVYTWPYVEGLTMAEATNDLAFMVTGAYGKPLPKAMGAPLRLALPWKYGFKSAKSIVKITFTDKRPTTFWQGLASNEYGFWANVNPGVPHPRWSQATEEVLGTSERRPTMIYNGYAEKVAALYTDIKGENIFM